MAMSPEVRLQRLEATKDMAAALLEDIHHIREITSKLAPERGELRRLSGILSRFLLENDLANVAAPRTSRVYIRCPDNQDYYRAARNKNLPLFCSGGASAFGITSRSMMVTDGNHPLDATDLDDDRTVDLTVDSFTKQNVLCFHGQWASRKDVILYIRHVGSGVHSGKPTANQTEKFAIVENVRRCVEMRILERSGSDPESDLVGFGLNMNALAGNPDELSYRADRIDLALFELLCAARFICESPDVIELESSIRNELMAPAS